MPKVRNSKQLLNLQTRAMRLLPLYAYNVFTSDELAVIFDNHLADHFRAKLNGIYAQQPKIRTNDAFFRLYAEMSYDNQDLINQHILKHYVSQS